MDSDDDYQSFGQPKEPSPPPHFRRLKRLKKSSPKASEDKFPESIDPLFSQVDFAKLEALENDSEPQHFNESNSPLVNDSEPQHFNESNSPLVNDSEPQYFNESNSPEEANLSQELISQGVENDNQMDLGSDVEVLKAKRVLEFDAEAESEVYGNGKAIGEDGEGFDLENSETENNGLFEEKVDKEKKKKREKSDSDIELKTKERVSNKRREEKERKTYLKELHAESQRLLRETRDVSFRPIPLVQKPISSVLEKIRKRKLEIIKKSTLVKDICEGNIMPSDGLINFDVSDEERVEKIESIIVEKDTIVNSVDNASSMDNYEAKQTINENDQNQVLENVEPIPAFRPPVDDTQDLFDSEPNDATAVHNDEQLSSPLKEDYAPSLLAMNLKFDSAPLDDSSSEEEDNYKENVDPYPLGQQKRDVSSSSKGDPVKDFIDEEAEEEDDSDNDLNRFQENEAADDIDDLEELNDMIASEYEERPTDKERRNELHQKWLEQQDAAGTDHLMQRLKCGSELRDAFGSDNEYETDEDVEELDQEAGEDSLPQQSNRVNIKKAKQIILESFLEKEDTYLSDDDDGMLKRHARCLIRKEMQATVLSPDDDAHSREVFGLIKKLNIASENKKKPKSLSIFDSVLQGENRNLSSKSSFLGRASKHPLPSSHKQGSTAVRAFIFGRDDSNSRSSFSISEDSSDTVSRESGSTRNITAKYINNSQSKVNRDAAAETKSRTSLLDILKRSSSQSQVCSNQNTAVDLTKTIFSFRAPKKKAKIEERS